LRGAMDPLVDLILIERIPVAAQRGLVDGIQAAVERGEPVLIFPQNKGWEAVKSADDFGALAAHTARKYHLTVLPAAISKSETWKSGNSVIVRFGEPFVPSGSHKREINAEMLERINAILGQM
jgi:SpoU rRNA methylase family enzyme